MRISGGSMRGRKVPSKRAGVRPTKERVREALFSSISSRLPGAVFLDLFAGSGVVGLEALSRGVSEVVWVDVGRGQTRDLEGWLSSASSGEVAAETRVICRDVFEYLAGYRGAGVDIIFADPPYDRDGTEDWFPRLVTLISDREVLTPGGILIMEVAGGEQLEPSEGWQLLREKQYGDTGLWVFERLRNVNE